MAEPRGIAIIGLACRFPGAEDARSFWANLEAGVESIRQFSDTELLRADVPERTLRREDYVKAAPVIEGHDLFDAGFFEYSPREARLMDPQQRILLEEAWHALEDAGYAPGAIPGRVGVFTGSGGVVTSYLAAHASLRAGQTGGLEHLGNDKDFVSTKLSYKLGLTGPSINVQTACSTSLVAVHLACQSILDGECEMALAGAATVRVPHIAGYHYRKGDILSPDGHCRAYDAGAEGTVFGSGAGLVLLKHVEDAVRDGDRIYAVIRGSAINNDGAEKVSYTASSTDGQSRAMIEALAVAEVPPSRIGYVEGHGTGTVVGDPLEVEALRRVFATDSETVPGGCWLGSVKTNIGHLEQTAGIASLIKAALAVHHGRVPPSLNFETPNPRIDFTNGPFRVPAEAADWPDRGGPRLAAVNSLGLGGTNAFAIIEEAPAPTTTPDELPPGHLLTLSAKSEAALAALVDGWRNRLADLPPPETAAACHTAARRPGLRHRVSVTGADAAALSRALASEPATTAATQDRKLAFLFPGQGAQAPGMARGLYQSEPAFREAFDRVAAALGEAGVDMVRAVYSSADAAALADTGAAQPALFAVEYALARMLHDWGVRPDAVLGHSVGAFAAAAVAGIWQPEDAAWLIAERARLMAALPAGGAMAAVFAGEGETRALIEGIEGLCVAALNAPENTVVSGPGRALDRLETRAQETGISLRRLAVSHAFHSPLMAPAADPLTRTAADRPGLTPALTFVSDLTGEVLAAAPDPGYLARHLLSPVRFADGLRTLAELGCTDVVEVGPGAALRGFASATVPGIGTHGVLDPKGDDRAAALATLGRLWSRGLAADPARPYAARKVPRGDAPLYPFQRARYWLDDGPAEETAQPLHGQKIELPLPGHRYQAVWSGARLPWLPDHRVYGHVTLPVAGALMALHDAAAEVMRIPVEIRGLTYSRACTIADGAERLVHLELPEDPTAGPLTLQSRETKGGAEWEAHVEARAAPAGAEPLAVADPKALAAECPTPVEPGLFYAALDRIGLNYGPAFRAVRALSLGPSRALARVALADGTAEAQASLHPALLDACLHVFPALSGRHGDFSTLPDGESTFLPISVERFRIAGPAPAEVWAHAVRRLDGEADRYTLDLHVFGPNGSPVALLEGLTVREIPARHFVPRPRAPIEDWLYAVEWAPRPALPHAAGRGRWIVLAEHPADAEPLVQALTTSGAGAAWLSADRLLAEGAVAMGEAPLDGLIDATALAAPPLMRQSPYDLAAVTARQFATTQAVLRALTEDAAETLGQPRLWLVTRGAQAPRDDRLGGEAAQAVLWGHGRVIALEHPNVWGGLIDLDHETDPGLAVREILGGDGEDQIALRAGRRYAPRLLRRPLDALDLPITPPIRPDRSYLVTGGLGALGLRVAGWLADEGARRLVLTSRRAPDHAQRQVSEALEGRGVTVSVQQADIADPAQTAALVSAIGDLDGVFHAAGVLDDGIMLQMGWEQYHRVTRAKIEGAHALHRATEDRELGHFVLFSSILSLIGSMGQLNYVAGNAFLDALVPHRRRLGLPAAALNWGPWEEAGLATQAGDRGRQIWRARGTEYIPAEAGMEVTRHALAHGFDHVAVTLTDWQKFTAQFAGVPKLYEQLAGSGTNRPAATLDRAQIVEALRTAAPAERPGLMTQALGQMAAAALELDRPPEPDLSLREAGLDSLMSIAVINEIEAAFGVRLPARTLLQGPSTAQLADTVLAALPDLGTGHGDGTEPRPAPAAPEARPGEWLVTRRPRPDARARLICFPFAGGGSAAFDRWGDAFPSDIEIVAVEPPGRLSRIDETPPGSVEDFARALLPQLLSKLDRPYAVLGHCLGGLTAYETLRFLQARKRPLPVHIFVSGARPPSVLKAPGDFERELEARLRAHAGYRAGQPGHEQPDTVFAEIVRSFGIAESLAMLESEELRTLLLPTVRAEFAMANRYIYLPEAPFPVPITCFRGADDLYFRRVDAECWGRFTSRRFEVFERPGVGHFAVVEDFDFIRQTVEERLLARCAESA